MILIVSRKRISQYAKCSNLHSTLEQNIEFQLLFEKKLNSYNICSKIALSTNFHHQFLISSKRILISRHREMHAWKEQMGCLQIRNSGGTFLGQTLSQQKPSKHSLLHKIDFDKQFMYFLTVYFCLPFISKKRPEITHIH